MTPSIGEWWKDGTPEGPTWRRRRGGGGAESGERRGPGHGGCGPVALGWSLVSVVVGIVDQSGTQEDETR